MLATAVTRKVPVGGRDGVAEPPHLEHQLTAFPSQVRLGQHDASWRVGCHWNGSPSLKPLAHLPIKTPPIQCFMLSPFLGLDTQPARSWVPHVNDARDAISLGPPTCGGEVGAGIAVHVL